MKKALIAAHEALGAGDVHAALTLVLEAWRAIPAAPIRELVERLGKWLGRERPPLTVTGTKKSCVAEWLAVEAQRDPADLERLLVALPTLSGRVAMDRLKLLRRWPADPRMVPALIQHLHPDEGLTEGYRALALKVLHTYRDPRAAVLLDVLPEVDGIYWDAKVDRDALGQYEPEPTLAPDALDQVLALSAAIDGYDQGLRTTPVASAGDQATGQGMLDGIYQHPADTPRRLVYADWLIERSDPRGEFIQLQCRRALGESTPDTRRRERALLGTHGREWLGALRRVVRRQVGWDRGFPDTVKISDALHMADGDDVRRLGQLDAWATVSRVDLCGRVLGPDDGWLAPERLRALHTLEGLSARVAEGLSRAPLPTVTSVSPELRGRLSPEFAEHLALAFPHLRRVVLGGTQHAWNTWAEGLTLAARPVVVLDSAGVLERLDEVDVEDVGAGLGLWLALFDEVGRYPRLVLRAPGTRLELERESGGWRLEGRLRTPAAAAELLGAVRGLRPDALVALAVQATPRARRDLPHDDLRAAAARFSSLAQLTLPARWLR